MPRPLRQCSTTVSRTFTCRTPGPTSRTVPAPSCPSRCGRNRSSPLAPSISPSCEPQMPLHAMRTRTCPASSCAGSFTCAISRGAPSLTRIAALPAVGRVIAVIASSLEEDEGMIAGIPGLPEPPLPLFGRIERLARHLPVEQVHLLRFVPVGLHAEVPVFATDALHFAQRLVQIVAMQVVQGLDRDHEVEALVRPRQRCRAADA